MFARYKRLVPRPQRELIAQQRLPKPNWFIGAAEQPLNPRDPALMQQIKEVKQRIRDRRNPNGQPGSSEVVADSRPGAHAPGGIEHRVP